MENHPEQTWAQAFKELLPNPRRNTELSIVISYVGTAKKHGKDAYEAIRNIFENNWNCVFE